MPQAMPHRFALPAENAVEQEITMPMRTHAGKSGEFLRNHIVVARTTKPIISPSTPQSNGIRMERAKATIRSNPDVHRIPTFCPTS